MKSFKVFIFVLSSAVLVKAEAGTMTCKGQSVTHVFEIKNDKIEIQSQLKEKTLTASRSVSDLKDNILYLGNETFGKLYDFNECQMADYRIIMGVAGPAGFRVLKETIKSCNCVQE